MIHLVVALAAEARPIARHLGLRGSDETAPFRLYRSESIRLVVTGVGRNACAAGAAYAFAKAGEVRDAAWINVGVAGHATAEIGSAFVAAKIRDGWRRPVLVSEPALRDRFAGRRGPDR